MNLLALSSDEPKKEAFYKIVAIISGIIALILISYMTLDWVIYGASPLGDPLVNQPTGEPFEFPEPEYFPIYAKPITWLYVSVITFWFSLLESGKDRAKKYSNFRMSIFKIVSFMGLTISGYEILYNFTIWSALMASQAIAGNIIPDILVNSSPNPNFPWNLVFATKMFTASFAIAAYSLWFIHQIKISKDFSALKTEK